MVNARLADQRGEGMFPKSKCVKHARKKVLSGDVKKQNLDKMPGFMFNWNYSGMEVEKIAQYSNDVITKIFVRKYSFIINHFLQHVSLFTSNFNLKPLYVCSYNNDSLLYVL